MSEAILKDAGACGAEAVITMCPMCHMNLDARQFQMNVEVPMPVLYFTQLMALALGLPEKSAALHKNLTDPRPILKSKGLLSQ